jgi:hypothetical protein
VDYQQWIWRYNTTRILRVNCLGRSGVVGKCHAVDVSSWGGLEFQPGTYFSLSPQSFSAFAFYALFTDVSLFSQIPMLYGRTAMFTFDAARSRQIRPAEASSNRLNRGPPMHVPISRQITKQIHTNHLDSQVSARGSEFNRHYKLQILVHNVA